MSDAGSGAPAATIAAPVTAAGPPPLILGYLAAISRIRANILSISYPVKSGLSGLKLYESSRNAQSLCYGFWQSWNGEHSWRE